MKSTLGKTARVFVLGGLFCVYPAIGISLMAPQQEPAPDNTKTNHDATDVTADQQSNTKADRELAQNGRRAIIQDKALSTYAHNVKVISQNGQVTLKGPVRSEDEKQAIEAKAAEVAGKANVVSELTVAPPNQ
jgi:hyperosmotically inducible periplasmic protein